MGLQRPFTGRKDPIKRTLVAMTATRGPGTDGQSSGRECKPPLAAAVLAVIGARVLVIVLHGIELRGIRLVL